MDISLDNPGFSDMIAAEVHDAPKSSGSSSASIGHPQHSCSRCPGRMSSIDRDRHLVCTHCRGYECSVDLRCGECESWSKEEMLAHEKYRKSLASKSKGRGKSSDSGFRVDPETVCVSTASEKVAGINRLICNLTKSPLLTLFFSVPRSQCSWDRCSSPTVGWVAGVCLSSLCADSCDSEKAPLVLWGPADNHSSLLAPEAVVSRASGAGSGRSGGSASGQGSVEPDSCSSTAYLGLSRLALHAWRLSSDLQDHAVSPGMWLNRRLWLGDLLLVRGTRLNGPFIGSVYLGRPFHLSAFSVQNSGFSFLASKIQKAFCDRSYGV